MLVGVVSLLIAASASGAAHAATKSPTILRESVSKITQTSATLKARIATHGLETKYEFWINYQPCLHLGCELLREDPELRGQGTIAAGKSAASVSARLSGLHPGNAYEYWVQATNSQGTSTGQRQEFPSP
jgi:hypothetical protein